MVSKQSSAPRLKLLFQAIILTFGISLNANADNAMRNIFNGMLAKTDPQSFTTATRVGAVGGSFSYRQVNVNTNLVSMSFPKASVGCNGIDVFLGSFSMINGDQLVQVARGIAQGAAIYAFNVAISAICADCAATINDIQNKLQALNKFAKDSCNATYSFLTENVGTPESFSNSVGSGPASVLNSINGLIPDFGASQTSNPSKMTSQAKAKNPEEFIEKFSGNILYMGFMSIDNGTLDIGGVTELSGYRLAEQLMSLVGTVIVNWDMKGEKSGTEVRPPTMNVTDYIYGPTNGTAIKMLKCAPAPDPKTERKAQCLTMTETTDGSFKGLQQTMEELLLNVQSKVLNNQPISDDEARMINLIGLSNIIPTLNTLSATEGYRYIQDISTYAATSLVINMFRQVTSKLTNMSVSNEALSARNEDIKRLVDKLNEQTKAAYELTQGQTSTSKSLIGYWDEARIKSMLQRDAGYRG
ncbi:conjugal transfer protein TraH [Photorhabdus heterorhabditis]|uniref:Conjugal transfer protein n=2 Tax=Photorhabdus heterorhabditis TaxID=880156 RepID=A0A5B0WIG4_9GAMM|nr:conjugal transfer protein [Photorhabdus heterorhabditis]MBS9441207.1 conjugal transfer protein [Photorhabdus heterorhabditis]